MTGSLKDRLVIPVQDYSFDAFHNFLFALYTQIILLIDRWHILDALPSGWPRPCDLTELYQLTDQYGCLTLRDRIGRHLVRESSHSELVYQTYDPNGFAAHFPDLREMFFTRFKEVWNKNGNGSAFAMLIENMSGREKEHFICLLAIGLVELQYETEFRS